MPQLCNGYLFPLETPETPGFIRIWASAAELLNPPNAPVEDSQHIF